MDLKYISNIVPIQETCSLFVINIYLYVVCNVNFCYLTLKYVFLAIEDNYSGPKIEDGKITLSFIKELMVSYKNEKKLHKKYAYQVWYDSKGKLYFLQSHSKKGNFFVAALVPAESKRRSIFWTKLYYLGIRALQQSNIIK